MADKLLLVNLNILRYVRKHGPVSMDACLSRFGSDARPRIVSLFNGGYIDHVYRDGSNRSLGFSATVKGRNALQDAGWATYERIRDSIVVPIIVTILTTILLRLLESLL